jgi:iron complex outermembrane receptor protein
MKNIVGILLATASLTTLASAAQAQTAPAAQGPAADQATLGEIVVTARRRSESLQEVPQTVNAVTADTLQKLEIKQFQDVQAVVPGLSLEANSTGFGAAASLRGVTFNVNEGSSVPTVALYMNDVSVQANFLFHAMFDVGQIEVLKGPQGTTRGISAPSGAITITTHKPDLSEFGGYADVTLTDLQGRNAQGAINIPIVKDVLAVRLAGVIDVNDFDGVRSIHSSIRPRDTTSAERVSVSFEPSDAFNANVTWTHLDQDQTSFQQVAGPGPGSFTSGTTVFPASYNPPTGPTDRVSVQDGPNLLKLHMDVVTAQVDSRLFGQHLSYVGSYQHQNLNNFNSGSGSEPGDGGDILPGIELYGHTKTFQVLTTHEFRVASDPAPGRFFDYVVGGFYKWEEDGGHVDNPGILLPGAFGTAPGIDLSAFNLNYHIPLFIDIPRTNQEISLFGNVTFHLGANTELSGGIRHLWAIDNNHTIIGLGNGMLNLGALGLPKTLPCSILGATAGPAPGDCVLPTAGVVGNFAFRASDTPNIYNVSLSHHFTRDFLVYVNTGTSYRGATASVGIQGPLAANPDPILNTLSFHPGERSRTYEVGFKSTWLDGRARLNASLFRQRFNNLTIFVPGISYLQVAGDPGSATNFDFTQSVDALVQGFDVDTAFQVTRDWNISAQMSYADGKVQGSLVPCNLKDASGNAVYNTAGLISMCTGGSSSRLPYWNASFQSEYVHPVADDMDGFFRVLASYYPENKNRVEADFTVPNYSLVSLYAGVRSHDGAWEASIFARNALNAQRSLDVLQVQYNLNTVLGTSFSSLNHASGYAQAVQTARREVGINVHYAWGSR